MIIYKPPYLGISTANIFKGATVALDVRIYTHFSVKETSLLYISLLVNIKCKMVTRNENRHQVVL